MRLRQISLAAISILLIAGLSCHRKNLQADRSTPTTGEVMLLADESFTPVVEPLLQVFNGIYTNATVRCEYRPEKEVMDALMNFRTTMVFTTRPLTSAENEFFSSRKFIPRVNQFATDAIALIVHPSQTDSLVSVGQINDVLTGKIRTWEQLGFNGNKDNIQVVFDNNGSATIRYMLDSICKGTPFGPGLSAMKGNRQVIDFVSNNPGSIGIIGVAWISSSRDSASLGHLKKVKVLRVSRTTPALPENSFLPYQAFIANRSYPLARSLYVINAEPWNGLATGMAGFACSDRGQRIILKTGILPYYQTIRNVKITD